MPVCAPCLGGLGGAADTQVLSHSGAYGTGNQSRAPSPWELDLAWCHREMRQRIREEEEKGLSSQNSREGEQGVRG